MMNCEDYRQAIIADPAFDGGDAHAGGCADCRAYRDDMMAFNARIATALAIDVPPLRMPVLPDVESDNVVAISTRRFRPMPYALAASVLLAVFAAVRLLTPAPTFDSLADEVLAHLDHEPAALRVTNVAVSERRLARAVPARLARYEPGASLVTYAQTCVINGKDVPHLVIQGEHGPVTILLMSGEKIAEPVPLDGERVHGLILPVGDGSIAIIGDREEALGPISDTVLNSVTWTT